MKLTKEQKDEILLLLQQAVQAQIDRWDAERGIENVLDKELDDMGQGIEDLAISCDFGRDVKLDDIQDYIDSCEEVS